MSKFDSLQQKVFNSVGNRFGEVASWTPFAGGDAQTATVFFNSPTEQQGLGWKGQHKPGIAEFDLDVPVIEYLQGTFIGLKESANNRNKEIVIINSDQYKVVKVTTKGDGKTHLAQLNKL